MKLIFVFVTVLILTDQIIAGEKFFLQPGDSVTLIPKKSVEVSCKFVNQKAPKCDVVPADTANTGRCDEYLILVNDKKRFSTKNCYTGLPNALLRAFNILETMQKRGLCRF